MIRQLIEMLDLRIVSGLEAIVLLKSTYELPITDRGRVMRASQNADADWQHPPKPIANQEVEHAGTGCGECGELLHGLNNALASVLLNAQVMAWKLPSYSRGKRYLHEIERNAQRAGELVKRLLERSQTRCEVGQRLGHAGNEARSVVGFDSVSPLSECKVAANPEGRRPTP